MKKILSIIALVCLCAFSTTAYSAALCKYTLIMTDSYGDGWNGAKLKLTDDNGDQEFTLSSGDSDTKEVEYFGGEIKGTWTAGEWDKEVGFVITALNGTVLYEHVAGYTPSNFTISADPCAKLGDVDVKVLIPSDCGLEPTGDVYFVWKGTDVETTDHKVKLTNDGSSRFWKATANIGDFGYTYYLETELSATEKSTVDGGSTAITVNDPLCFEVGPVKSMTVVAGVTYYKRYNYDTGCEAEDHNYNITSATATPNPLGGEIVFNWIPEQNAPNHYEINIEYEAGSPDAIYAEELPYKEILYYNEEKKITKWTVTASESFGQVGQTFESTDPIVIPASPYQIKNLNFTVGEGNVGIMSWDELAIPANFSVSITGPSSETLLDGMLKSSELTVKDGKYVVETIPLSNTGDVYVYISIYDTEGNYRAMTNNSFTISSLPTVLGTVNIAVLIQEDLCDFDASGDIYFQITPIGGSASYYKAEKGEGRWFTLSTTVNTPSFSLAIGNKDEAEWSTATKTEVRYAIVDKTPKFFVVKSYGYFYLFVPEGEVANHDMRPTDVAADVHADEGYVEYTISAKDKADYYEIYVYKSASSTTPDETYTITPAEDATLPINYKAVSTLTSTMDIEKVEVAAYSYEGYGIHIVCDNFSKLINYTIPLDPRIPRGLTVTRNTDNSVTMEWKHTGTAIKYAPWVQYNSKWYSIADNIYTAVTPPTGGKYSVTFDHLLGNGDYLFEVDTYEGDFYNELGEVLTVTDAPELGTVTIRVLKPSDNNFPDDPQIYWWGIGKTGQFETTTKNGNWYEATFTTTEPSFQCLVANKTDWSGKQTQDTRIVTTKEVCFELDYNTNTSSNWILSDAECSAEDHDYRISTVTVDNSTAGLITATITAMKDYAPYYMVTAREAGSSDPYEYMGGWEYTGAPITFATPWATAKNIDIRVYSLDAEYNQMADPYEATVSGIKANPNTPSDLKAEIGTDGQTVNFSWTKNGTPDHFAIVVSTALDLTELEEVNITGTTASGKFYISGYHNWTVYALDNSDNVIGFAEGPVFLLKTPDFTPSNLNANIVGNKVNLSWDAPKDVTKAILTLFEDYSSTESQIVVTGTGGRFYHSFTVNEDKDVYYYWSVASVAEDGKTMLSDLVTGSSFNLIGFSSTPDPALYATLTVKAGIGGRVSVDQNGTYLKGTSVTVSAYSDTDWSFLEWSDGYGYDNYTFDLTQDTVLEATFLSDKKYIFKATAGEGGKVNSAEVDGIYKGGRSVHLKATPSSGYNFDKWSDADKNKERDFVITENTTLKALFAKIVKYTLTVEITGSGTVTLDGAEVSSKTVEKDKTIALAATPASGYKFVRYEIDGANITSANHTVTMTKSMTAKAIFEKESMDIDNVASEDQPKKFIQDGQLYILRDGKVYNVTGARVK